MNVSPATKAAAISDYLAGKGGYFQIALEYGINPYVPVSPDSAQSQGFPGNAITNISEEEQ